MIYAVIREKRPEAASAPGLSWYEYHLIIAHAENVARRAGLLREARENGIC